MTTMGQSPIIQGLSPRMRGNQRGYKRGWAEKGPIPAHAGEPSSGNASHAPPGAYPRACGGTDVLSPYRFSDEGLSPRMRGNHIKAINCWVPVGPIPAHAGEPHVFCPCQQQEWAYPRACGGTICGSSHNWRSQGLSPRMRGNPKS